jgi:hypothetical protein
MDPTAQVTKHEYRSTTTSVCIRTGIFVSGWVHVPLQFLIGAYFTKGEVWFMEMVPNMGPLHALWLAVLIISHTKYELPMILPYHLNLLYFDSIMAVNLNYPCHCWCTVVFLKLKISAYLFRDLGFISVPPLPIISESVNPFPDQVRIIRTKFV